MEEGLEEWRLATIEVGDQAVLSCPRCKDQGAGLMEPTWKDRFFAGALDLVSLDRLTANQLPNPAAIQEPSQGRRLLSFADSRQKAARLAPRLAFTHRVLFVRRWMIDVLQFVADKNEIESEKLTVQVQRLRDSNHDGLLDELVQQKELDLVALNAGIDVNGLIREMVCETDRLRRWAWSLDGARFQKRFHGKDLLSEADRNSKSGIETLWYGLIRGQKGKDVLDAFSTRRKPADVLLRALYEYLECELKLAVLREICRPPGRTPTARKLGLIQIRWPMLTGPLSAFNDVGVPAALHQELFERACALLVDQRCVRLPDPFDGMEEDWGSAFLNRKATLQETGNKQTYSLATDRHKVRHFTAILHTLAARIGKAEDEGWIKETYVALWNALRFSASPEGILSFGNEGGVDYIQVDANQLRLRASSSIYLCRRCGTATPWSGLETCTEPRFRDQGGNAASIPCGGELLRADPKEPLEIEWDAFPHARSVLLKREAPQGMAAFEHTAQRSGDQVRRDELLYRRGSMNVLSSSTTLEMGVDLPDLDSVVLMGVPPAAANHTQRVGRAGRKRERACLALTLAGDDSFERWAHRDLQAFLQRPGIPPKVDLEREEKLQQHFFAWRLGLLLRTTDVLIPGRGASFLNQLSEFAGISEDKRVAFLERWRERHPDIPWRSQDEPPGWGDEAVLAWTNLDPNDLKRASSLFNRSESTLSEWLSQSRMDLQKELDKIRERVANLRAKLPSGTSRQEGFYGYLLKSLRHYDCLNWLAENHLLPRYGFPVSTVALSPPGRLKDLDRKVDDIDRDRRQAVMEWTPGASVVVANYVWTIKGLGPDKHRGHEETHHRLFSWARCECGHQFIGDTGGVMQCSLCGKAASRVLPIAIPFGFVAEDSFTLAGTETEYSGPGCSRILTLDDRNWGNHRIVFQSSVQVAFLNIGAVGDGFWLCGCGALRTNDGIWRKHCPKDSEQAPSTGIVLGEVRRMDVLRFLPRISMNHEGLRALAQALRLAAAFLLELDPRTLALADIQEDGQNVLYLVDLTDGGSGLLARLQESELSQKWLNLSQRILAHEHRPSDACVNACPDCILTHDNRVEHSRRPFRRKEGLMAISRILENPNSPPLSSGTLRD